RVRPGRRSPVGERMKTTLAVLLVLLSAASPSWAVTQKVYARRMQAQLDNLSQRLQALHQREYEVRAEDRESFKKRLAHLWQREREARVGLEAIKHAPDSQWEERKKKEDPAVISLMKSYRKLVNRY